MPLNMRCLIDKSNVTTECINKEDIIISESELGKCYTYLESSFYLDYIYDKKLDVSSKIFGNIAILSSGKRNSNTYSQLIHDRN